MGEEWQYNKLYYMFIKYGIPLDLTNNIFFPEMETMFVVVINYYNLECNESLFNNMTMTH